MRSAAAVLSFVFKLSRRLTTGRCGSRSPARSARARFLNGCRVGDARGGLRPNKRLNPTCAGGRVARSLSAIREAASSLHSSEYEHQLMAITRINEFQAKPDKAAALRDFLRSVIARIIDAPGCRSCELLIQRADPSRLAIIEVWDSMEAHQASVSRIPPGLLQQAQTLFAVPARGAYYEPLGKGTGGTAA